MSGSGDGTKPAGCVGHGAGWGTIEGVRLRVLLLADPRRAEAARAMARAIGARHEVTLAGAEKGGLGAKLGAAAAAARIKPDLVHAVGIAGAAGSAALIAGGAGVPLIASVGRDEIARSPGRVKALARRADMVVLPDEASADELRAKLLRRELYVISTPEAPEDDPFYIGALEVVYGRAIAARRPDAEHAHEKPEPPTPEGLIQIGGKKP